MHHASRDNNNNNNTHTHAHTRRQGEPEEREVSRSTFNTPPPSRSIQHAVHSQRHSLKTETDLMHVVVLLFLGVFVL